MKRSFVQVLVVLRIILISTKAKPYPSSLLISSRVIFGTHFLPEWSDSFFGLCSQIVCLLLKLILFVSFLSPGRRVVHGTLCELLCILSGRWLSEFLVFRLEAEFFPVKDCSSCRILFIYWLSFLSVLSEKFEESLVSSNSNHLQLECVIAFRLVVQRFHVALEHWISLLVL